MAICLALIDKTVSIDFNFFPWCVFETFPILQGIITVNLMLDFDWSMLLLFSNLCKPPKIRQVCFFNMFCGLFTNHTFHRIHIFFVDPRLQSVALMIFFDMTVFKHFVHRYVNCSTYHIIEFEFNQSVGHYTEKYKYGMLYI